MRKRKNARLLLLFFFLAFLSAPVAGIMGDASGQKLRIVMPMMTLTDQSGRLRYAEELLSERGFEVEFEVYRGDANDYFEKYMDHVWENLDENAVFIVSKAMKEALKAEGAFQSWEDALIAVAPDYRNRISTDDVSFIPTNFLSGDRYRVSVLTRNDEYLEYGEEINTASDLEDLLLYLSGRMSDSTPGLASPYMHDNMNRGAISTLSLFLPEWGYYPVGLNSYYDSETEEIREATQIPASADAFKELARWRDSGLISYWNARDNTDISEYPVILMSLADFLTNQFTTMVPRYIDFDWSRYHISILYADAIPYSESVGLKSTHFAMAGEAADKEVFAGLMQWLEEEENYRLFFYGKEGEEYELQDGAIRTLNTDLQYSLWDQLTFFRRDALVIKQADWPAGMAEALEGISYPYDLPIPSGALASVESMVISDEALAAQVDEAFAQFLGLVRTICMPTINYEVAVQAIDTFFSDAAGAYHAEQLEVLYRDALRAGD